MNNLKCYISDAAQVIHVVCISLVALAPIHLAGQCSDSSTEHLAVKSLTRPNGNLVRALVGTQTVGGYWWTWDAYVSGSETLNGATIRSGSNQVGVGGIARLDWDELPSSRGVGTYILPTSSHRTDSTCGASTTYSRGSELLVVQRPSVSGSNAIWYLGGGSDPGNGYYNSASLTGNKNCSSCSSNLYWQATVNAAKISLNCSVCSTNIVTSQAPSSGCQYDISLQASIDGLPSDPFQMTVNTPSYLEAAGAPSDAAWMGAGFQSTMPYYVRDHCGYVMSSIAVNEEFNAFFPDTSNNWPKPTPINASGFSGGFSDVIGIWGSYSPQPLIPQSPLTSTKVDHATQYFRIGSATTGSGVLVKTTTHQKYLDHGRHEP